jgi:Putative adhesin
MAAGAQAPAFQRSMELDLNNPLLLTIELTHGDVIVAYSRDGQISISVFAKDISGKDLPEEFFRKNLSIEHKENQITVRDSWDKALGGSASSIMYRFDVPFRTQLTSSVSGRGNQKLIGIAGPATIRSGSGDIKAEYVTQGRVDANTGKGNISCSRVFQVMAETDDGNIILMEDGPSKAIVSKGAGKIEVGGARGTFEGSVQAGILHIKAAPYDHWKLSSESGSIRIELPPKAAFELDASTVSGEITSELEEIQLPVRGTRQLHQAVNGGGKRIDAHSQNGSIFVE